MFGAFLLLFLFMGAFLLCFSHCNGGGVAVFKKLTNAVVVDTDFINITLTKPSTKSRQRNNN